MDETTSGERRARRCGRVRGSQAEVARLLSEYRTSGQTQDKFAAAAGIKVGTLRAWIYKRRPPASDGAGAITPVRIVGGGRQPVTAKRGAVTVRWPQGIEVEIAVELDGAGVGRLVRELLAPCLR